MWFVILQAFSAEHQQLRGSTAALERELAAQAARAAGQEQELAAVKEANRQTQSQISQQALDIQVSTLSQITLVVMIYCSTNRLSSTLATTLNSETYCVCILYCFFR